MVVNQRADYTFKYNKKLGRHGWLRLTPAYSVKLVEEIVTHISRDAFILDPFSGTATTGLVAAEHGLSSHGFDINPFLIWFGNAKCRNYSEGELKKLRLGIDTALIECHELVNEENWVPDMHNITRWWCAHTLKVIAALRQALVNQFGEPKDDDVSSLAWISFCRLAIETSSAAFDHVSMSFHNEVTTFDVEQIQDLYLKITDAIIQSAAKELANPASIHFIDSREPISVDNVKYSHVITSPPYPNRISYVRELRPYMYWTKFLNSARDAGELDWKAIGGTWGVATSKLKHWEENGITLPQSLRLVVLQILETGEESALLMANYVWKYFHDMYLHLRNLRNSLQTGAVLTYIVGNSSFYGVQVHTEKILEDSLNSLGFTNIGSRVVRKRNSKKELFEYCVYATWNESRKYSPDFFDTDRNRGIQLSLF